MPPPSTVPSGHPAAETPITGRAAGVPFVARAPRSASPETPPVLAWHLLDPPRTESALAAALPLAGLDAWRIYLGLPLCGERLPPGGLGTLMERGASDAVLELYAPIVDGAVAELPDALGALERTLGIDLSVVDVLGGSIGAVVAGIVVAEAPVGVRAAVLVSPLVQLRPAIDAMAREFGFTYPWPARARTVANRLDLVARADAIAQRGTAVRLVVGAEDGPHVREPAGTLGDTLRGGGSVADAVTVAGMAHALAEEPSLEPAAQTGHARVVDGLAVEWFRHAR